MKIFPIIAKGLIFSSGSEFVSKLYEQLQIDIKNENFKLLEVVHHFSSGMKDVFS